MGFDHVQPGELVTDHLSAENWNRIGDVVNTFDRNPASLFDASGREHPVLTALVKTDDDVEQGGCVALGDPLVLPDEGQDFWNRIQFTEGIGDNWGAIGIPLTYADSNYATPCAVGGFAPCKIFVEAQGEFLRRAYLDPADSSRLITHPAGNAHIVWKESGAAQEVHAIVRIGPPDAPVYNAIATEDISVNTEGTVSIHNSSPPADTGYTVNAKLDWHHNNEQVSSGVEVSIKWFPDDRLWRIMWADCEP